MMDNLQPIYRIEDYWYAIANGLSCPHTPIYRIEQYLAYLCGADVEIPQPIYRIEQYLAYKCGMDVEIPNPIYRQELFLAKWCGLEVDTPEPIYRIEYWLNLLANPVGELKTVTGNPISISDALAKPAEALTVEILPYQSGSGDPSPDNVRPISGHDSVKVTRTGVNVWDEEWEAGGLANATGATFPARDRIRSKNYSPCSASTSYYGKAPSQYLSIFWYDSSKAFISWEGAANKVITSPSNAAFFKIVLANNVTTYNNDIAINYPSTDHDYHAYNGTTYSISWQDEAGTVYGGELDVTTGVLTVTKGIIDIGEINWDTYSTPANHVYRASIPSGMYNPPPSENVKVTTAICDSYYPMAYSPISASNNGAFAVGNERIVFIDHRFTDANAFTTANQGTMLCYDLATPQTIQLTPTEIEMLLGENTVWSENGDITLTYMADGNANDVEALNILLGNRYVNLGEPDEATDREALDILLGGNTR